MRKHELQEQTYIEYDVVNRRYVEKKGSFFVDSKLVKRQRYRPKKSKNKENQERLRRRNNKWRSKGYIR